ncbi:MAG: tRNA adenosine(34) deaminase TadA [Desulfuromonadaceae bacterium]|nr:tRNA adenosine(34) deaminase TadA [Desulfuromonadaceae bacterium]
MRLILQQIMITSDTCNAKGKTIISSSSPSHIPAPPRSHEQWMRYAIVEAAKAESKAEVPIGCVIVREGRIIARGHNLRETSQDPTGHAELIAIRKAARKLRSWRLLDTVLYVTLEPCTMCMGAIILARIPTVVFGCYDPKGGAAGSLFDLSGDSRLNHRVELFPQVLESECSALLTGFFAELRSRKRTAGTPKAT